MGRSGALVLGLGARGLGWAVAGDGGEGWQPALGLGFPCALPEILTGILIPGIFPGILPGMPLRLTFAVNPEPYPTQNPGLNREGV